MVEVASGRVHWDIILQGSSHTGPLISPPEILIAIHGIDPDRDGIPLKKVITLFFSFLLFVKHTLDISVCLLESFIL